MNARQTRIGVYAAVAASAAIAFPTLAGAAASTTAHDGIVIYDSGPDAGQGIFAANADASGSTDLTHSGSDYDDYPSVSPDGTHIAFDHTGDDGDGIAVMNADGTGRTVITPAGATFPVWSPDGTTIAFAGEPFQDNSIYVVHPDGSGLRRVAKDAPNYGIAWSPDSRVIAYGGSAGLSTVDITSGVHTVLVPLPGSWRPAWSPDGTRIAFDDDDGNVRVVAADGSNLRNTHVQTGAETPSWSSDGTRLVVGDQSRRPERIVVIDLAAGTTTPLTASRFGESSGDPTWSPDGRIAFLRTRTPDSATDLGFQTDVWVMNGDGSGQQRLTSPFPLGGSADDPLWLTTTGRVVPDPGVKTVQAVPTRVIAATTEKWLVAGDATSVYMANGGRPEERVIKWSTVSGARRSVTVGCADEMAVVGARLVWLCIEDDRDGYDRTLETAPFGSNPVKLLHVSSATRDPMELGGTSSLVVYSARGRLWRLAGTHSSVIRRVNGEIVGLATDGRFIAVVHPRSIEIVRANGARVHSFALSEYPQGVRITNGRLVFARSSGIFVYRATGALVHSWPIESPGPPARLLDARGRYAVYTAHIALRLLDLRTGRDVALGLRNQIDMPKAMFNGMGLAYFYPLGYARVPERAGRVGFVPFTRLRAMLRSA